jgi:translation initiation factor IF-3
MYRGREMVHRDIGRKQLEKVVDLLGPLASVENPPRMEGRFLSMILVPNREAVDQARKVEEAAAKELETAEATEAKELDTAEAAEEHGS